MRRWLTVVVLLLLVSGAQAQQAGKQDTCRNLKANPSGTGRQPITVSTSAITVVAANQKLCDAVLTNTSNTQKLRCAAIPDGDPTASAGFDFLPLQVISLEFAAQKGLKCVRDTSASADVIVSVIELEL